MPLRSLRIQLSKLKATIINDIWVELVVFTLVASVVTTITELTPHRLAFSDQLMTVLGIALGFVISFRTSTAYERFTEGRLYWTQISIASRNLAQIIWIQVPLKRPLKQKTASGDENNHSNRDPPKEYSTLEVAVEKKSMINLVQGFSVAVKHMLRGESGVYYRDLYPLVAFLPRFAAHKDHGANEDILPLWHVSDMELESYMALHNEHIGPIPSVIRSSTEPTTEHKVDPSEDFRETKSLPEQSVIDLDDIEGQFLPGVPSEYDLGPARDPPDGFFMHWIKVLFKWLGPLSDNSESHRPGAKPKRTFEGKKKPKRNVFGRKHPPPAVDSIVPMEIATALLSYHEWLVEEEFVNDSSANRIYSEIAQLQNSVAQLERIKNTPLPFAYQAHLRFSLWLYLFFLPSQLYDTFHWLTIPATTFSAFVLLGFLEIGQEIENPFNYGDSDLNLDAFCYTIAQELHEVTAHTISGRPPNIFSIWNKPFAPEDSRTAKEIISDASHSYHQCDGGAHALHRTMLKSWKKVHEAVCVYEDYLKRNGGRDTRKA